MDRFLRWCNDQRDLMLKSIQMMENGKLRLGEIQPDGRQTDQTQQWISTLKSRVADLDTLLPQETEDVHKS